MSTANTSEELSEKLDQTIRENKEFLDKIDAMIQEEDLKYAQMLINEEKGYLKMAKKSLEEKS